MLAAPLAVAQAPTVRSAVFSLASLMRSGSPSGLALYALLCVAGSLLTVPLWMMAGLAGYAYGFARGAAAALPAITLGGCCAFLAGRALARTALGAALREHPRFRMIEAVVRHDGRRIAALLRVTPVMPQNILHYALGATPLPLRDFAVATFVGLLPMVSVQAYAGSLVRDVAALFEQRGASLRDPATWAKGAAGLVVTAVAFALIVRRARRALAVAVAEAERSGRAP